MPANNKSKATVGGVKKQSTMKMGLIAVAVVLALTGIGYYGYGKYQEHTLKAHAANWTGILTQPGYGIWACKTDTIYGPYVTALFIRSSANKNENYELDTFADNTFSKIFQSKSGTAWWGGTVAAVKALAPSGNDAVLSASIGVKADGSSAANNLHFVSRTNSGLANC